MSKVQKALATVLAVILALFILFMLIGAGQNAKDVCCKPYLVCSVYTLYDIAEECGTKNPANWSYDVCKKNGIPDGGLIFPGDVILVYTEGE